MLNSETREEMRKAGTWDHETRLADSREKRDLVMSKIREAYYQAKDAADSAEFAQADALLSEALAWMKNGWDGFNTVTQLISSALSTGIMTRGDREECWAKWKEAKELLRLRRDKFYAQVRAQCMDRWRDWVQKNEEFIEKLQAEIDECQGLARSARTEEFAERVRDRLKQRHGRSQISKKNQELEIKLADAASNSY
jgi:hypothetical protein